MTLDFEALKAQGNEYLKKKDFDKAVECYSTAAELSPENHIIWSNRSAAHLLKGDLEASLTDAERCLHLAPNWAKGYHRIATVYQIQKRFTQAIQTCTKGAFNCREDSAGVASLEEIRSSCYVQLLSNKLAGDWKGKVSEEFGGYEQKMTFSANGQMTVELAGSVRPAMYTLDTLKIPVGMDIIVEGSQGSVCIPYIMEFVTESSEEALRLCTPFMSTEPPKAFSGPGVVVMRRFDKSEDLEILECIPEHPDDQLKFYMAEFARLIEESRVQQPVEDDPETEANKKALKLLSLHVKTSNLQRRFTPDVIEEANALVIQGPEARGLDSKNEISLASIRMRSAMLSAGLLTEETLHQVKQQMETKSPEPNAEPSEVRKRLQKKLVERRRERKSDQSEKEIYSPGISPPESPVKGPTRNRRLSAIEEEAVEGYQKILAAGSIVLAAAAGLFFWLRKGR